MPFKHFQVGIGKFRDTTSAVAIVDSGTTYIRVPKAVFRAASRPSLLMRTFTLAVIVMTRSMSALVLATRILPLHFDILGAGPLP